MKTDHSASQPGLLSTARFWALRIGLAGFLGGFLGPMVFAPDANQGPMLGIFITGPLGLLAGALFGIVKASLTPKGGAL